MTREQITKAFEATLGMSPRRADIAIIEALGSTETELAEYIWDHLMGEPDEPSLDRVLAIIKEATQ